MELRLSYTYPSTWFHGIAGDPDEAEEEGDKGAHDRTIMPEVVVCLEAGLEAGDEFLRNRIMNLPENVVADTHNTEEGLKRRLEEYKAANTEDETVLNFFDEVEIHPEKIGELIWFCNISRWQCTEPVWSFWWYSTRLQYLQCVHTANTAVLL